MKRALITGITGQDGSYLSELLLEKGYEVHGLVRRSSEHNTARIDHLLTQHAITLHSGDMTDAASVINVVKSVRPDEIYNLAAQSNVAESFATPEFTNNVNALGVLRLLDAMRICELEKTCRFYQASTSELFGKVEVCPQNEDTPFHPYSPYALSKQHAYWSVLEYREAYDMFACNGILFNHESERRGEDFVTRKITLAAARIACGLQSKLELGNLSSLRDWGYAKDYVECMWRMLQQDSPDDYVIATCTQHSVREFATLAFSYVGIDISWEGEGPRERGIDTSSGRVVVQVNPAFYRPTDVVNLMGDSTKAQRTLGWNPTATSFEKLCQLMVEHDLSLARSECRQ